MTSVPLHIVMDWADWLTLFGHFLLLSVMSVGGAISTSSEMHRFLVEQHGWLTQQQFNGAITLAQAAPGPNVLFVALMGWQVGLNAGSTGAALLGVLVTMVGVLTPSSIMTYTAARWGYRNRHLRAVRAFKQGMAPVVIALLLSTAWLLASSAARPSIGPAAAAPALGPWALWLIAIASCILMWRTRLHLLWLLAAGAVLGACGFI